MTYFIQSLSIILLVFSIIYSGHGSRFEQFFDEYKSLGKANSAPESELLPEVNAVLLKCPKEKKAKVWQMDDAKDEKCESQLMVNIRVNPSFHVEKVDKFLILDEVYDPRTSTKAKILSPYLIEISRGEPIMMYPLEFSKVNISNLVVYKDLFKIFLIKVVIIYKIYCF